MRFMSLRAWFLVGFVVAMPVLALPPVARQVNELLYGVAPTEFATPGAAVVPVSHEVVQPLLAEQISPAGAGQFEPTPARPRGLDAALAQAPPRAPEAAFAPLVPAQQVAAAAEVKIDDKTIARLQKVRERLEHLGAEYVIAEALDGTGEYHFHCRMLVDPQSRFTKPFEATATDPLAAAERVLSEVENWHTAAAAATTRRE